MSVAREYLPDPNPAPLTDPVARYLEAERQAEFKSEYLNGEIVMMASGSPAHSLLAMNLGGEFYAALRGSSCRVYSADLKVRTAETQYVYPDLTVICGDFVSDDRDPYTATNPRLIVEVVSPSTERNDRLIKWLRYQMLPSLTDYLLVSQDQPLIEHFARGDNGPWQYQSYLGLEAELIITSLSIRIPLSALYDGVEFASDSALLSELPSSSR